MQPKRADLDEPIGLTDAEQQVVRALLRGLAYGEIADLRAASTRTVANQIAAAYRKTGARSRTELAARQYPVPAALACTKFLARALPALSERERSVVYLAALGHTNKWIAFELDATLSTVASHLRHAIRKLGLRCRVELARVLCERARALDLGPCDADTAQPHAANDGEPRRARA